MTHPPASHGHKVHVVDGLASIDRHGEDALPGALPVNFTEVQSDDVRPRLHREHPHKGVALDARLVHNMGGDLLGGGPGQVY
jgi:hypothetical protein